MSAPQMTKRNTVELGALADPLTKQLKGMAFDADLEHLERDRVAITRCLLRAYIPEAQAIKARAKLLKGVQLAAAKFAKAYNQLSK